MRRLAPAEPPYPVRVGLVERADALAGLGDYPAARAALDEVRALSPEPILRAICDQAEGEYLTREGDVARALRIFVRASRGFGEDDASLDFAVLCKWRGYALGRLGRAAEARRWLARAERRMADPGLRAEVRLGLWQLRHELGWLGRTEAARARFYPDLNPEYARRFGEAAGFRFGARGSAARLEIHLDADEYRDGALRYPGLPLEIRLLGWLAQAGAEGLPRMRLLCVLWPDEPYAIRQLGMRLDQLIAQLRRAHAMGVEVSDNVVRLDARARARVATVRGDASPGLLRGQARFTRRDFEAYYDVRRSRAPEILAKWVARGWIRREGSGPATVYVRTLALPR